MTQSVTTFLSLLCLASRVYAHGRVTSPSPRPLGSAMQAACGQQVYNQMASDPNGNIQAMAQTGSNQKDFDATACHLWQCRGYQFADASTSSIYSYQAGQVVDFTVDIVAPHTGVANVSVINLSTNAVIGEALASWDDYASVATGVSANETSFSVTIPSDLPSACLSAGGCALQWWWDAPSISQTYMSCVDFTVGSASGAGVTATTNPATFDSLPTGDISETSACVSLVTVTLPSPSTAAASKVDSACTEEVTVTVTATRST